METFEIRLDKRDLKVISENLNEGVLREKFSKSVKDFEQSQQQIIRFDEEEIDEITNCLSDLFCKRGLFENDEPNAFGYYIENLIDKFSIE